MGTEIMTFDNTEVENINFIKTKDLFRLMI